GGARFHREVRLSRASEHIRQDGAKRRRVWAATKRSETKTLRPKSSLACGESRQQRVMAESRRGRADCREGSCFSGICCFKTHPVEHSDRHCKHSFCAFPDECF